jgi:hypothetical protein
MGDEEGRREEEPRVENSVAGWIDPATRLKQRMIGAAPGKKLTELKDKLHKELTSFASLLANIDLANPSTEKKKHIANHSKSPVQVISSLAGALGSYLKKKHNITGFGMKPTPYSGTTPHILHSALAIHHNSSIESAPGKPTTKPTTFDDDDVAHEVFHVQDDDDEANTAVPTSHPTRIPANATAVPTSQPTRIPTSVDCYPESCNVCPAAFDACCNEFVADNQTRCTSCAESMGCEVPAYAVAPSVAPTNHTNSSASTPNILHSATPCPSLAKRQDSSIQSAPPKPTTTTLNCYPGSCNVCPAAFNACCNGFVATSVERCTSCVESMGCEALPYTMAPTVAPTFAPTKHPTVAPTHPPSAFPTANPTMRVVCIPRLCNVCPAASESCCDAFISTSYSMCKRCVEQKGCDGVGYSAPPTYRPTVLPEPTTSKVPVADEIGDSPYLFEDGDEVQSSGDDDDLGISGDEDAQRMPSLPPSFEPTSRVWPTSGPTARPLSFYEAVLLRNGDLP